MALDTAGHLWLVVTGPDTGHLLELEPGTGVEVSRLPLPDQDPVDLVFAGPDLSMLYILTKNSLYTVRGITLLYRYIIVMTHLYQVWESPGSPCRTLSGIQHRMIRKRYEGRFQLSSDCKSFEISDLSVRNPSPHGLAGQEILLWEFYENVR